jgi:hypothetical protein
MKMVECKKCGGDMPKARKELGYNECIKCSVVQPYGHVHIFSSKTANTIQILPAKLAHKANRYAQRNSFGVLKTMVDTKKGTSIIESREELDY